MQASGRPIVRFGQFELDPVAGDLYRDGRRVRLQEQPRQVLVALLERPGELVTREALRERLWKSDTFVDFEHGLNTAVKKARRALGDSAEAPKYIETLARRGYRFIGPIEPRPESGQAQSVDLRSAPAVAAPRPRAGYAVFSALAVMAIVVIGIAIAGWARRSVEPKDPTAASSKSAPAQLAVMPLRVLPGRNDSDYLGVGIADAITTRLAQARQIALRPTSAVLPFNDAQSDPARVASALGVQHLLLGTIQPGEHNYRITVQLVGADGVAVWGDTFDEPDVGLPQVQDHIADAVVAALRVEVSALERERLHARHTGNAAAYDFYLRGRSLLVNYTEANMHKAIGYFEQALELDPQFALARTGIATAAAWFSVRYAHGSEALVWGKRADQEARLALKQDSSLADAHLAIASAAGTLYGGFEWNVVLDRSATALSLDPSLDLAHVERMRAYYHLGLTDEARAEARLAKQINPTPNVALDRIEIATELYAGEFSTVAERATAMLARTDAPAIRHYLGLARYYLGDPAAARKLLASVMRGDHPDARSESALASIEAASGLQPQARAHIAEVLRGSDIDHHVAYSIGAALAQLRDRNDSLRWLDRAVDTGFPCLPMFESDTLLDPLRRDAGFVRLMERLRTAREQARARAR
jgi:DNA-binding winged helix-turn-helix (wHTH) protein/TolB-like protein/tetratricopeptide (TPR) repeat protein